MGAPAATALPASQEWNLWYEQGVQAGPDDSGPISGLDALCGGAADDGSTPSMLDLTGRCVSTALLHALSCLSPG